MFEEVNFYESKFNKAEIKGSTFDRDCSLSMVKFTGSYIGGSKFNNANLDRAVLKNASITTSTFEYCDLDGTDFKDASLESVHFSHCDIREAIFIVTASSVVMDVVGLKCSEMWGASFSSSSITNSNLSGVNLRSANLSGIDLRSSDLSYANLDGADLSGTDLTGADLVGASIVNTKFVGASLSGTMYENKNMEYIASGDPLQRFLIDLGLDIDVLPVSYNSLSAIEAVLLRLVEDLCALSGTTPRSGKSPAETVARALNALYERPEELELGQKMLLDSIAECVAIIESSGYGD